MLVCDVLVEDVVRIPFENLDDALARLLLAQEEDELELTTFPRISPILVNFIPPLAPLSLIFRSSEGNTLRSSPIVRFDVAESPL